MSLLPDRHPNLDFFVLDIADAVPKDDMASMEHPLFSLATKPDMRHLEYRNGDNVLKIRPSGLGLPTIFDKDILIFTISQLMARKNRGNRLAIQSGSQRESCLLPQTGLSAGTTTSALRMPSLACKARSSSPTSSPGARSKPGYSP
jgi:hypothetical protein